MKKGHLEKENLEKANSAKGKSQTEEQRNLKIESLAKKQK